MAGFSEKEEALIKSSWEDLTKNFPTFSFHFFTLLVELAPPLKDLFPFLKGSSNVPKKNPQLEAQALKVFKLTFDSAIQLREKGEVVIADPTLKQLSSVHVQKGVIDAHFEVVKEALLKTVKEAAGAAKWSDDLNNAWAKAHDAWQL
ncbi:non-symbiotic hemoglobin 2-like [Prosopis cineraria]|uniref:non-symbiotic hemoglobin 2-like n=1 Tax=Prosopis cineraria TaxID=364024 RepID=UPI00241074FB|nr:non-symbiotic hemoglobin 2-like [Prosopis cineraria]